MKCSICSEEREGSVKNFIWIKEGETFHPYIAVDVLSEWMARSITKHKKIPLSAARKDTKKAILSKHSSILQILQHKSKKIREWKIVYDYVCEECSDKKIEVH